MGNFMSNMDDPRAQFFLNAGAGMLSQPYTSSPQSGFEPFARGLQQGTNAYQNARYLQQIEEEKERERKEREAAAARHSALVQQMVSSLPPGTPPEQVALIHSLMEAGQPQAITGLLKPKEKGMMGSNDWKDAINVAAAELDKSPEDPAVQDRAAQIYQSWMEAKKSSPLVSIMAGEEEAHKLAAKARYEAYNTVISNETKTASQLRDLEQLYFGLKGYQGGPLSKNIITPLRGLVSQFGLGDFDFDTQTGRMQAARSLENRMVVGLRNPAEGAGMPGHLSDRDVRFLETMPPGLGLTERGRDLLYAIYDKRYRNELEAAEYAHRLVDANGGVPPTDFHMKMRQFKDQQSFLVDDQGNLTSFGAEVAKEFQIPLGEGDPLGGTSQGGFPTVDSIVNSQGQPVDINTPSNPNVNSTNSDEWELLMNDEGVIIEFNKRTGEIREIRRGR